MVGTMVLVVVARGAHTGAGGGVLCTILGMEKK